MNWSSTKFKIILGGYYRICKFSAYIVVHSFQDVAILVLIRVRKFQYFEFFYL